MGLLNDDVTNIHTLLYLPSDFRVAYAAISEHLTIR